MRAFVVVAVLLAACQGPAPPAPDQTPSPSPAPTPTATPTAASTSCPDPLGCYGEPELVGTFDVELVPEASGLAAGLRNPGVLYLLDDRPGTAEIWAVRTDGTTIGSIPVPGLDALDTESLAIGPCGPQEDVPCLYVGDIGDNLRARTDITVHRMVEPDLSAGLPTQPPAVDTIRLRYPDEPHDAEALLVDDAGVAHIVTKARFDRDTGQTAPAQLFRAPDGFTDGLLVDLGELPVPAPGEPAHSRFVGNVVTGGEHRDGRVLLRTYDQVLEYVAPAPSADLSTLASWRARPVPSPFEPQSEAITWAADGCGYYTVGEMVGDIWFVPCVD